MIAFHGDEKIKEKYLERLRDHAAADEIIKGIYWENGKGCAVGCTIHSSHHQAYEIELGIPQILAYLEDILFENLPNHLAKEWPLKFLGSIKTGVNLELIWPKFAYWLLMDKDHGVIKFNNHECIINIGVLLDRWISGNKPSSSEWKAAYTAADAYAESASASASASAPVPAPHTSVHSSLHYVCAYTKSSAYAYAINAAAAYASANAAVYAANSSANAAAYAYAVNVYTDAVGVGADADAAYTAANTARQNHYMIMSEKLLELLGEAK